MYVLRSLVTTAEFHSSQCIYVRDLLRHIEVVERNLKMQRRVIQFLQVDLEEMGQWAKNLETWLSSVTNIFGFVGMPEGSPSHW